MSLDKDNVAIFVRLEGNRSSRESLYFFYSKLPKMLRVSDADLKMSQVLFFFFVFSTGSEENKIAG